MTTPIPPDPGLDFTSPSGQSPRQSASVINLVLAAGQVPAARLATLKTALDTISASTDTGKLNRVKAALTLVLAAPEYIAQK